MFAFLARSILPKRRAAKLAVKAKPHQKEARLGVEALEDRTMMNAGLGADVATNLRRDRRLVVDQRTVAQDRAQTATPRTPTREDSTARAARQERTTRAADRTPDRRAEQQTPARTQQRQGRAARETAPAAERSQRQAAPSRNESRASRQNTPALRTASHDENAARRQTSRGQTSPAQTRSFREEADAAFMEYAQQQMTQWQNWLEAATDDPLGSLPSWDEYVAYLNENDLSLKFTFGWENGLQAAYDTHSGWSVGDSEVRFDSNFDALLNWSSGLFSIEVGARESSFGFGPSFEWGGFALGAEMNYNFDYGYQNLGYNLQDWYSQVTDAYSDYFGSSSQGSYGGGNSGGYSVYYDDNAPGKEHHN